MRNARAVGRLLAAAEVVAFYLAVGPVLALLPAPVAYRVACWRGDLMFRTWTGKRGPSPPAWRSPSSPINPPC